MIALNISTSKKEFLDNLAMVANEEGKLYVRLESLPVFLGSPISFTVFNYQISNYPREIIWASNKKNILDFLENCNVSTLDLTQYEDTSLIKTNRLESARSLDFFKQPTQKDYKDYNYPDYLESRSDILDNQTKAYQQNFAYNPEQKNIIDLPDSVKYNLEDNYQPDKNKPLVIDGRYTPSDQTNEELTETPIQDLIPYNQEKATSEISFRAKDLLEEGGYHRSSLLDKLDDQILAKPKNNKSGGSDSPQNNIKAIIQPSQVVTTASNNGLARWLDKIENTEQSLKRIKQNYNNNYNKYNKNQNLQYNTLPNNKTDWRTMSVLSLLLTFIIVGFVSLFPTRVYTINVNPKNISQSSQISLPLTRFNSQEINLETTLSRDLDTKATQEVDRAIGQVEIVNSSGGAIAFDRGGIILTAENGRTYRQVPQPEDPGTYRLPAGGGSVTITIQATANGSEYNLDQGQILTLRNLKRESLGNRIQARVITKISNIIETENKIVTEQNYSSLKAATQDDFQEQIQETIANIDKELYITNPHWYRDFSTDYVFSDEVGETTDSLDLQARARTEMFYLSKINLEEVLRAEFSDIRTLKGVEIESFDGGFNNINQSIKLSLNFVYIQKTQLDRDSITRTLSQKDFDSAKADILKQYPNIESINELRNGLNMPGVPSILEIEIQENY